MTVTAGQHMTEKLLQQNY